MIKRTWIIPLFSLALSCAASAQTPSPDQRAFDTEQKMTDDERFAMLFSLMGVNGVIQVRDPLIPARAPMSAGYVSGVPRLGVPALIMSDGSLGITNPGYREGDTATALPAGLMLGSSFNPQLARAAGAMLGREARSRGFNVQLAGGTNRRATRAMAATTSICPRIRGIPPCSRPRRSTAFNPRASSRPSSTTRSTSTRLTVTG